jgi:PASTA domain
MRCRLLASLLLVVVACSGCGDAKDDVRVPNLVGLAEPDALGRLEAAQLCVGKVSWAWDGPADAVVKQSPTAGTAIVRHGRVSLTLSPQGPSGMIYSDWLDGCADNASYRSNRRGELLIELPVPEMVRGRQRAVHVRLLGDAAGERAQGLEL